MSSKPLSVVVLISGRGSNLQALIDSTRAKRINAQIAAVISNVPDAQGLLRAKAAEIHTDVVDHKRFSTRLEFDEALRECIDRHAPDLIVLAGFMRVLTTEFVNHYRGRLINIHPSLLPAFPGLHTHRRALNSGVSQHGVSVHFVTAQLDDGPVIAQARIPVLADDDEQALAARVLAAEHRVLPQVVGLFAAQRVQLNVDGQIVLDGRIITEPIQQV